ncbi:unnamed protein product [Tilletia controversa]|uniref:HSF-type DNA-binding domain-containing protein n=3 Tax=Tilletia TaxID=13289 RepID=A0A8X7SW33_9BASI|nr:hypothetical protein CF336_g6508 [Tilletia laevis]KAE8190019.1 hypothetical protein CF328_g6103 [Tilletia controversa]KAE8253715.1 hypothetical protein A4X03_0g5817 [Tilletia caries]KAE8192580.1 hypothetical protein CF335_g5803 [Tilletia laevis]KAE8246807.1 hypothetical protein A4X06_0g4868 [Tilletia controversa]
MADSSPSLTARTQLQGRPTTHQSSQHAFSQPQPIDFSYNTASIRPYLSTSFKTSAERSISSRFREHRNNEDEDQHDIFPYNNGSSPFLPANRPLPQNTATATGAGAGTGTGTGTELPQRLMSLGHLTLNSPDIRPNTAISPLPTLSALNPGTSYSSSSALGTSPGPHAAYAQQRRLSNHRAPTMRDVYGTGSPSSSGVVANAASAVPGVYGVSPSSAAATAAGRLSSSLPAPSGFIPPGTSPSSAAAAAASARRISHGRPVRPGLVSASSNSGALPTLPSSSSATRQGPYSRPSYSSASNRSQSRNRLSFGQQGGGPGTGPREDRNNSSGLGLLGAAALADAASPPFALRPTRMNRFHNSSSARATSIADSDLDFAMEDIEGPFNDKPHHHHHHAGPSSSDLEEGEETDLDELDEDDELDDEMMLSLVNEVDDAEATEDESEEIKEHIRSSGASSYTKPGMGPGMGQLLGQFNQHPLGAGAGAGVGAHRNSLRSMPTAVPGGRARSTARHSVGGIGIAGGGPGTSAAASYTSPSSSLGLNFREAHGHAPHQPYPSRAAHQQHHLYSARSPRLGGQADLGSSSSSSPIYSASVPTTAAGVASSLQRQVSSTGSGETDLSHASSALAAMRHYPFGSSPATSATGGGGRAAVLPPRSALPTTGHHRRTQSAQTNEDGGSEAGSSSADGTRLTAGTSGVAGAAADISTSSMGAGTGTGLDENAEVALIRDRLGGAAHCSAFISKLWYLLINPTLYSPYIRWSEAGDSIILSNEADVSAEFANEVLPRLFKHGNNASFIRQLNLYGFQRVPSSRLLDQAEVKAAARIMRERERVGGAGVGGRSLSRGRNSDAVGMPSSSSVPSSSPLRSSTIPQSQSTSGSPSNPNANANGGMMTMTTALHLYGPHSSFAHPSFRRGQESLLPSMKPRSSKKPKGAKAGAAGGSAGTAVGGAAGDAVGGGEGEDDGFGGEE